MGVMTRSRATTAILEGRVRVNGRVVTDPAHRVRLDRSLRESELATARGEHEGCSRDVRSREQDVAAIEARLGSLEAGKLADVVVKVENGKPILLRDVANVVIGHQPMIGDGITGAINLGLDQSRRMATGG